MRAAIGMIILAVLLPTGQARGLKAHEVWQPLRRRDYHALRTLSEVAPVTRRSVQNQRHRAPLCLQ
jgi:hypothetical protein